MIFENEKLNIYLVDDAPYNLLVMKELLKTLPCVNEVQTALSGQQAIDNIISPVNIVATNGKKMSKFNYIFMDLNMPVMDGI